MTASDSGTSVLPPVRRQRAAVERHCDHASAVGVEGGVADEPLAPLVDREPGRDLLALDQGAPLAGRDVDQVDVVAAPPQARRARARSVRRGETETSGHAVGSGRSSKRTLVVRPRRTEPVPEHVAVVVAARRVTRVREPAGVRQPADGCGAGVGDLVGKVFVRTPIEHPQRRTFVTGRRDAVTRRARRRATAGTSRSRPFRRRQRSWDRGRSSGSCGPSPSSGRTHSTARSWWPQRSSEKTVPASMAGDDEVPARNSSVSRACRRGRAASASSAARVRAFWYRSPRLRLGGLPVLQPAVRVRDLDAVDQVDVVGDPRDLDGSGQPRPVLGLRPWLAFLRRARFFCFAVRFDMDGGRYSPGWDPAQATRSSAPIVLTISPASTPIRAALSHP